MNAVPRRSASCVGERLDVPRPAGRVDDPGQARLVVQDRLGVAGDAPGEVVRQPDRRVERQHGDRLGAADRGGEAGDRRAQHVHPRVAAGHHRRGRDRVLALPAPLGDAPHSSATRSQIRRAARSLAIDGELVGGDGEAELERVQRVVDGQPGVGQRPQVGDADRGGDGELVASLAPASW